jgi:arylsulfatase A-like enzyme
MVDGVCPGSPAAPAGTEPDSARAIIDRRSGILSVAAWCGLASGLLEVLALVIRRTTHGGDGFYRISRHFVWMIPLTYLILFLLLGAGISVAWGRTPAFIKKLSARLFGILTIWPALLVGIPQVYPAAWLLVSIGIVEQFILLLRRCGRQVGAIVGWSLAGMFAVVGFLLGWSFLAENPSLLERASRPRPPNDSPNILLIVLDTVGADHLSVYGYHRRTSPTIERLAAQGVRFGAARSTAPWTLPSHASMFTGRWPNETSAGWTTPLDGQHPTLAEFFSEQGYDTAAFVANLYYCGYDSGLARGFSTYKDHRLTPLTGLTSSRLGTVILAFGRTFRDWTSARNAVSAIPNQTESQPAPLTAEVRPLSAPPESKPPGQTRAPRSGLDSTKTVGLLGGIKNFRASRKDASMINQEFLDWLSRRDDAGRPFLAFLNYWDAHHPYVLPTPDSVHFGLTAESSGDMEILTGPMDKQRLNARGEQLLRDAYDDCIAFVDRQLGLLVGELSRRGVLDQTVVIITSDHGESLGEHDLFGHGLTLYRPELHVPLLILGSSNLPKGRVVSDPVSLRDIPATIVDLLGIRDESPFPGNSLARYWSPSAPTSSMSPPDGPMAELDSPQPGDAQRRRSPAIEGPLASIVLHDLVYIRNLKTGREELYNWRLDPLESKNIAGSKDSVRDIEFLRRELTEVLSEDLGRR